MRGEGVNLPKYETIQAQTRLEGKTFFSESESCYQAGQDISYKQGVLYTEDENHMRQIIKQQWTSSVLGGNQRELFEISV